MDPGQLSLHILCDAASHVGRFVRGVGEKINICSARYKVFHILSHKVLGNLNSTCNDRM